MVDILIMPADAIPIVAEMMVNLVGMGFMIQGFLELPQVSSLQIFTETGFDFVL